MALGLAPTVQTRRRLAGSWRMRLARTERDADLAPPSVLAPGAALGLEERTRTDRDAHKEQVVMAKLLKRVVEFYEGAEDYIEPESAGGLGGIEEEEEELEGDEPEDERRKPRPARARK